MVESYDRFRYFLHKGRLKSVKDLHFSIGFYPQKLRGKTPQGFICAKFCI